MATLNPLQIFSLLRQAGFNHDQAITFTAIALAESGGNTRAHATRGEDSVGLWQINLRAHRGKLRGRDPFDPLVNAQLAYQISRNGTYIQPWTVTHNKRGGLPNRNHYSKHFNAARSAAVEYLSGSQTHADTSRITPSNFNGTMAFPLVGFNTSMLTRSGIGDSRDGGARRHKGLDLMAPRGTPIVAVVAGIVVGVGYGSGKSGFRVNVRDKDGNIHGYYHMEPSLGQPVRMGQFVNPGTKLGYVGSSEGPGRNNGTSPHLHYSINEAGSRPLIDPFHYLRNGQAAPVSQDEIGGFTEMGYMGENNMSDMNVYGAGGEPADLNLNLTREEALERVADEYPALLGYLNIPGVADLLVEAVNGRWTAGKLQSRLQSLPWWQSTDEHRRVAAALKQNDPATYDQAVRGKAQEILDVYAELGLNFGETIESVFMGTSGVNRGSRLYEIAESYYLSNLTGNMLKAVIVDDEDSNLQNSGMVGKLMMDLQAIASEFLVKMSSQVLLATAKKIASGEMMIETWVDMVHDQAIARFAYDPNIVAQIENGVTPEMMFDGHRMAVGELLEMDADSIDLMGEDYNDIIDFVDPNGKRRSMTEGEARDWARYRPEFMNTQNSKDLTARLTTNIRNKFGVA